jgi:hypothetical protein
MENSEGCEPVDLRAPLPRGSRSLSIADIRTLWCGFLGTLRLAFAKIAASVSYRFRNLLDFSCQTAFLLNLEIRRNNISAAFQLIDAFFLHVSSKHVLNL